MRKFLLLLSFKLVFINVDAQKKDTSDYFEGVIEYATKFNSQMPAVSNNELRERIGHIIKIYFRQDGFKWIFFDDLGYIKSYFFVDLNKNTHFEWTSSFPDTIYTTKLITTKRLSVDSISESNNKEILGCLCNGARITGYANYENPIYSIPTTYYYYFCPTFKINPDPYRNYNEMRWNEIINTYKSVALEIISEFKDGFTAIFTATKIQKLPVDKNIFDIDKTKIIKATFID